MSKNKRSKKTKTKSQRKSDSATGFYIRAFQLSEKGQSLLSIALLSPDPERQNLLDICRAGAVQPATRRGHRCLLCGEPYSPSRRPGRFVRLRVDGGPAPAAVSAICIPCLSSLPTEAEVELAVAKVTQGCP